ncbi:MAG: M23 family metallopeptidase [Thermoanaerobaculia bacterium]|nr:M23 family metallopeptidase [Thermoanaerobaculia bacterium]
MHRRFARRLAWPLMATALACDGSSPTSSLDDDSCGPWPSQASSPYVLPYASGEAYTMVQGNCSPGTHAAGTRDGYAYDFSMPIGTTVIAARGGVVAELEEGFEDGNGVVSQANYVLVQHDDGTAAVYFHLTRNGVLVDPGRAVRQGDPIAHSGQTGRAGISPHLHFGVLGRSGLTIPVTFRNTEPHPDGLQRGSTYLAF